MTAPLVTKVFCDWTADDVSEMKAAVVNLPESPRLDVDSVLAGYPSYSTKGAGAFDLRAFTTGLVLHPGQKVRISSGLRMQLPEGHSLIVMPRSGSGSNGLVLANTVGLIDQDYRGVVWLTLWNVSNVFIPINPLDRVMQAMIIATPQTTFERVSSPDDLTPTDRGEGGFGSTGAN